MANPLHNSGDDTGLGPDRETGAGTPRWVTVFGIVVLVLVLLAVVIIVTGVGGEHGPRRHMHSRRIGGQTPAVAGMQRP